MLKYMRDHLGKTFLFIIVGLIALVFVFMGVFPETGGMGGGASVATVGGERISIRELQNAVERDLQNYRPMGMDLPPELINNIRQGTLQNLVRSKLMLVEARRLGIQASDKEVKEEIEKLPYFLDKKTQRFDVQLYRNLLRENGMTTGQFEEDVRNGLTNQRLQEFLSSRIRITPQEVEREYKIANETRNLEFIRFSREDAIKKMSVDAKEVDAFLADKNKEAQVTSFYASNNARYNKEEQVCARHILKRADPKADAKTAPKEFLDLKPTPGNFASVADKSSEDPSLKGKGGDLGCFGKGAMDPAFQDVAFATPVGKVSQPVKSGFGWHYIYVYKKVPGESKPLETVKRDIASELLKKERIEEIRKINFAAADEAMKNWPPKGVDTTGPFNSLEGMLPKIGTAPEILKAAFDPGAKIQTGPQRFEAQGGVIVARVKEKKSADMSKLAAEKDKQLQTLRERKIRAFLPAWLEDVQKRTKVSFNSSMVNQM
jgi:peptidyl-prolyl cis-trans isomerase D